MNQGDQPDLLVYHGPSCLDGLACVWALHQRWPNVPVFEGVYGQAPPDVTGLRVLISDFSYSEEVMREMAAKAGSITVLDHHRSSAVAFRKLFEDGLIRGVHDESRSGASLTWEYVWGQPRAPKLIEHVQDRDLWKFEIPGTKEVTAVLGSIPFDQKEWTEIGNRLENGLAGPILEQGAAIIRAREVDMRKVMEAGERTMIIGGHRIPVCNAPYFWASDIGHVLAKESEAGFAATYMDLAAGRQFSLRSRDGEAFPVHLLAEEYGGGGHPPAAGFTAPIGWEGDIDQDETVEVIPLNPGGKVTVK